MSETDISVLLYGQQRFTVFGEQLGIPLRNVFMTSAIAWLAGRVDRPLRILEVGSWVGASAATWSEGMTKYHPPGGLITCIDPWEPYPVENEHHNPEFMRKYRHALASDLAFRLFRHNTSMLSHRVVPIRGRSTEVLPLLRDAGFDLVYVDGDHSHDACRLDIEEGMRLVAPGGLLCGDDLDLTLAQVDPAFVRANRNKQPAVDPQGRAFHPGVTLAVGEAFDRVGYYAGFWGVVRGADGFAPMSLEGQRGFLPGFFAEATRERVNRAMQQGGFVTGTVPVSAAAAG